MNATLSAFAYLVVGAVVLSGCAAERPSEAPVQARGNAICTRINTSPFLSTKGLYDADLRKTKLGLRQMSSLVTSAPNKRELRDLVENMKTIYVFDRIHEPEEIAFLQASKRVDARVMKGQPPRWGKAARRYMAMVSRQTGGAEDEKFRDARALGLDACNEEGTVATVTESGSG